MTRTGRQPSRIAVSAAGSAGNSFGGGTRRSASIQDVAATAGVSTATVSRALNTPALVSAETARRVQEAVRQLGYRPNVFAKTLTTRRSQVLGVALPDIHGEFYSELLRGADAEARRLGYHLLVSSEPKGEEATGSEASLPFGLVAGLALMLTEPNEELLRSASEMGLPMVVLDAEVDRPGVDSVMIDNEVGTREAVEHLLRTVEPERVCFVGGPRENFDTQRRAEVVADVLRSRGVEPRNGAIAFGLYAIEWGREWASRRLERGELRGCAVLAGNDEIALGVLQAAAAAGLSVPGDLRVIGFDDTRLASLVRPALTTVQVPMTEVGAAAVRALVRRIGEPEAERTVVVLPTRLIERET